MIKKLFTFLLLGVGWLVGYGMRPVEAQWSYVANAMPPLSTDGTNIILASGQLLLPDGAASAPAWAFTNATTTGMMLAGSDMSLVVAGAKKINFGAANVRLTIAGTASTAAFSPAGNDANTGFFEIAEDHMGIIAGGALVVTVENTNAAGVGANLLTVSSILGAMDSSGDIVNMLLIDANGTPNHSDGNVFGANFDLQAADAQSIEAMIHGNDTWDYFIDADTALGTPSWTTNADKDGETAVGTIKVWINGTLYHIQLYADS